MFTVAVGALTVAAVVGASTGATVRHLIRQGARERQLLIDQICHLSGRAWTPPPAEVYEVPEPQVLPDPVVRHFGQYPDGYDFDAETEAVYS